MLNPLASNKPMLFILSVPNQPMVIFLEPQDNAKSTYPEKKNVYFGFRANSTNYIIYKSTHIILKNIKN